MANNQFPYENLIPSTVGRQPNPEIVGGRYELLALIGEGSMSRVYRARDRVLDRIVAIKLLREEYGSDQNFIARFYREAHAVALLSGSNLVDIYDYGQHGSTYFIAMQYIEGADLKSLIRQNGPLSIAQAVRIINQVLDALIIAHSQHLIHRDVKPQNILIRSNDGLVKLTDFGVAHAMDGAEITIAGSAIGTAYYMSPEQAKSEQVSPATDIYSVGIVLYELLSGKLPFFGTDPLQVLYQQVHKLPPSFASIGVNVPPQLEQVVQKALAKDPEFRYKNAAEMKAALDSAMSAISTPSRVVRPDPRMPATSASTLLPTNFDNNFVEPVSTRKRSGIRLPLLLGLFLLLLVAIGAIALLLSSQPSKQANNVTSPISPSPINTTTQTINPTVVNTTNVGNTPEVSSPVPATTTIKALPTVTPAPPTATSKALPPTSSVNPTPVKTVAKINVTISPFALTGSYRRDDSTLYGRPEVALYGAGTKYAHGTTNFNIDTAPEGNVKLVFTGIDDERTVNCTLRVIINGAVIFDGPNTFPNAPTNDNGVGGTDRVWGQMNIDIPAGVLKNGANSMELYNTTPSSDQIGIPYLLINQVQLQNT